MSISVLRKPLLHNLHVLRIQRISLASLGLTGILAMSACGDDDGNSEEGSTSASSTGTSTTSATGTGTSTSGSTTSGTTSGTAEDTGSSSSSDGSTADTEPGTGTGTDTDTGTETGAGSTGTDTEGDLQSRFGAACESYHRNVLNCDGDPLAQYDAEYCISEYGYLLADETCAEAAIGLFECMGALSCDELTGDYYGDYYHSLCEAQGLAFEEHCYFYDDTDSATTFVSESETGTSSTTGDTDDGTAGGNDTGSSSGTGDTE